MWVMLSPKERVKLFQRLVKFKPAGNDNGGNYFA